MTKSYAQKSSAVRAAKKEMGANWEAYATVEKLPDGEFVVELKPTQDIAPIAAEPAPALPATLAHIIVAEESAPAPVPALPAFLQIASQPEAEVAPALPGMITEALPQDDLDVEQLQAEADAQANTDLVNDHGVLTDAPVGKADRPRLSTTEKPTKKVWAIADEMVAAAAAAGTAAPKRKEVIEECVRRGVAYGTARTQYQHWFKCIADQASAPLAVIGADGKVTMTNGGN